MILIRGQHKMNLFKLELYNEFYLDGIDSDKPNLYLNLNLNLNKRLFI